MIIKSVMKFVVVAIVVIATPAMAANYNLAFDGAIFDVNAAVQTDAFDMVLTISGAVSGPNGAAITGLTSPLDPQWSVDNMLTGAAPYVTNGGILFTAGAWIYNLYSVGNLHYLSTFNPNGTYYNPGELGTLTVSSVPLPAAAWLFGSAILGLAGVARRKQA